MGRYLVRRLGFLVLTLLVTSIIIFVVTQVVPGDIARVILGREAGEAAIEALRQELRLNDPLPIQYLRWLGNFVTGDWGTSFSTNSEIRAVVTDRLVNSLALGLLALLLAVPISLLLGVIAGLREGKWADNLINVSALSVVGLPEFVTGLILIQLFSFSWGILPSSSSIRPEVGFFDLFTEWQHFRQLILPALTATFVLLAYIVRMTRAGVIEELNRPYVRTAALKGLPQRTVLRKHVLRNALSPTVTVIAISVGWLISGLVVIENVFNYPGLGRILVFAIDRRDLPLLQAVAMVTVVGFVVANTVADLLYAVLNPRIRLD